MIHNQGKLYFLICMLLPLLTCFGQKPDKEFITMDEAISRALGENNSLKASEFALRKAEWDTRNAWTQLFPSLTFNTRFMWIDDSTYRERDFTRFFPPELNIPKTVFQETWSSSLDLEMPLFNWAAYNGIRMAKTNEKLAKEQKKSNRQVVIFEVLSGYLNILKAKEILVLQKEYLELSKLNYKKAERLYQADRYSKTEALRWKLDFQQQKSLVVTAETELKNAVTILNKLINKEIFSDIDVDNNIPKSIETERDQLLQKDTEEIYDMIKLPDDKLVEVNAGLAALRSGARMSELNYQNSYSSYMPNINLAYTYAWRDNNTMALDGNSPQTLVINFSLPIFSGFKNYTSLKSNYHSYKQNKEEFNDQLKEIKLSLTAIANTIINLRTQLELSDVNVELSDGNYRIVEQQKEKGLVSNIDFIDAKLNNQKARQDKITADYDFISVMVQLYYMLGQIDIFVN